MKILDDNALSLASADELRVAYRWLRRRIDHITQALADLRAQGKFTGGYKPYGFTISEDGELLVEVDDEQRAIERARELRGQGLSLRAVAATMEEEGIVSRAGTRFEPVQISRMLRSSSPAGPSIE